MRKVDKNETREKLSDQYIKDSSEDRLHVCVPSNWQEEIIEWINHNKDCDVFFPPEDFIHEAIFELGYAQNAQYKEAIDEKIEEFLDSLNVKVEKIREDCFEIDLPVEQVMALLPDENEWLHIEVRSCGSYTTVEFDTMLNHKEFLKRSKKMSEEKKNPVVDNTVKVEKLTTEEKSMVKFPNVKVELVGLDGNAFVILGTVLKALRNAGVPKQEIDEYSSEAMSGDYNYLLATSMKWVDCSINLEKVEKQSTEKVEEHVEKRVTKKATNKQPRKGSLSEFVLTCLVHPSTVKQIAKLAIEQKLGRCNDLEKQKKSVSVILNGLKKTHPIVKVATKTWQIFEIGSPQVTAIPMHKG